MLAFVASDFLSSRRWIVGDAAVGLLAYTQADTPLKQLAALSGTSSVAMTLMISGTALYLLATKRLVIGFAAVAVIWVSVGLAVPGETDTRFAPSMNVAVVQGAQPDQLRLVAGYDDTAAEHLMGVYERLATEAVERGAELVILGETVLPARTDPNRLTGPVRTALSIAPTTVVGAHEGGAEEAFNSAFVWNGTTIHSVYRKQALVPIIESAYTPGTSSTPVMLQGALVGLGICLDTVHAGLVRESVLQGAELLVFITDDTFAGFTSTPHVHLRTAALRAAETGRAVVFANESGPSAMFDPRGNVVAYLPHGEPGVVVAELPLAFGTTPFVALGDWLGWLCVVATAVLAGVAALRPRRLERDITSS